MSLRVGILQVAVTTVLMLAQPAAAQDTSPFEFASEYVRELGAISNIQESLGTHANSPFVDIISKATTMQLELGSSVGVMKRMRLSKPHDYIVPAIISNYETKRELYLQLAN